MNTEKKYINEKEALFNRHIIYDGCMWCFLSRTDDFVKIDMKSWQISYVRMKSKDSKKNLFCQDSGTDGLICEKDIIYRVDFNAQGIHKYNLIEKKYEYIKFDFQCKRGENFAVIFANKQYIYFFMIGNGVVYKLDTKTEKIYRINKISQLLECDTLITNGIKIGNRVWLFSSNNSQIIEYDMDSDECYLYNLPVDVKGCIDVMFYEEVFWILDNNYRILTWNHITGNVQVWWKDDKYIGFNYYAKIVVTENKVYLLPSLCEDIIIIDKWSRKISKLDAYPKDFKYLAYDNWSKFLGYSDDKTVRYYSMRSANYILKINLRTSQLDWIRPIRPTQIEKYLYHLYMGENKVIMEQDEFLREYITLVTKQVKNKRIKDIDEGQVIYSNLV